MAEVKPWDSPWPVDCQKSLVPRGGRGASEVPVLPLSIEQRRMEYGSGHSPAAASSTSGHCSSGVLQGARERGGDDVVEWPVSVAWGVIRFLWLLGS